MHAFTGGNWAWPSEQEPRVRPVSVPIQTPSACGRSLHDALCVVRSLVKTRALLPGGGAVEMELAVELAK